VLGFRGETKGDLFQQASSALAQQERQGKLNGDFEV
jgi:hypothetical protein